MSDLMTRTSRFLDPLFDIFKDNRGWFVGVDKMIEDLSAKWDKAFAGFQDFPKSVIERKDATHYLVAMDVPGFAKEELKVEIDGSQLVITGRHEAKTEAEGETKSESRSFEQRLLLADQMKVQSAKYEEGKLTLEVEATNPPIEARQLVEIQ